MGGRCGQPCGLRPPGNTEAGTPGRCLEQLGYQSEAATWRNAYLTGAAERGVLGLSHRALHLMPDLMPDDTDPGADCSVTTTEAAFAGVIGGNVGVDEFLDGSVGRTTVLVDAAAIRAILENLDHDDAAFEIVLP